MSKRKDKELPTKKSISRLHVFSNRLFGIVLLSILILQPLTPVFAYELNGTQEARTNEEGTTTVQNIADEAVEDFGEIAVSTEGPINEETIASESTITDLEPPSVDSNDLTSVSLIQVEKTQSIEGPLHSNTVPLPDIEGTVTQSAIEEIYENEVDVEFDAPETNTTEASTSPDTGTPESLIPDIQEIAEEVTSNDEVGQPSQPSNVDENTMEGDIPRQEATTTSDTPVVVENATTNDNQLSFAKSECVKVGDGSFYCSTESDTPLSEGADRVFSAPDAEGDREIYIEKDGELTQITNNQSDDDAPFYDEVSNAIVWHRLTDGRYQIFSYDIASEREEQLTADRYNNMEPTRYGDITVWQGWVGNDWEIMLENGDELTMLTDNTIHDVSPRINGNYIIWQAFEDSVWRVKVYDRTSHVTETIGTADGGSVENPRFVLVYDTKYENGDVETKGYDLKTGTAVPLSAVPGKVPDKLPDPDQTGESRALLQIAPQPKQKSEIEDDLSGEPVPQTNDDVPDVILSESDIVIPDMTATSTEEITPVETTDETGEGSNIDSGYELIVPPLEETTGTSTDHIDDLIITPFVEATTPTLDSQEDVASST